MRDRDHAKGILMRKMKRLALVVLSISLLTTFTMPCYAAENPIKDSFESAFYGGLLGSLVGAAMLAFTKTPSDHLDYMVYGAAGGVFVGAAFGIAKSTRALAEYENGSVKFAMPTIMPELRENVSNGQPILAFNAQLVRGQF